jgi:hypothetical protein
MDAGKAVLTVEVNEGGLGTAYPRSEFGVRQDFSFIISYQPGTAYAFRGWQALLADGSVVAEWIPPGASGNEEDGETAKATGEDKVRFTARNPAGTDVEVVIVYDPGQKLLIRPRGAENPVLAGVRVNYGEGWGQSSHSRGAVIANVRKGFPLTTTFIPGANFAFVEWRAYRTADYKGAGTTATPLGPDMVHFSTTADIGGTVTAIVTVNTADPVTLVPWCDERPQITRSNPPLTPALSPIPYNRKISLWFNMAIDPATATIGRDGTIRISAIHTSGENNGQPFGVDGDISDYFKLATIPFDSTENRLEIVAKEDEGHPALNLRLLNISAVIGPGIRGVQGNEMAAVQTISYTTDTSEAQKIYEARSIQASRDNGVT